jgi:hypothetical protein
MTTYRSHFLITTVGLCVFLFFGYATFQSGPDSIGALVFFLSFVGVIVCWFLLKHFARLEEEERTRRFQEKILSRPLSSFIPPSAFVPTPTFRTQRLRRDHLARPSRGSSEWWANYQSYLASPEWERKRAKILAQGGYTCRCGARATQVHHLSYDRVGNEADSDLVGVCAACHAAEHDRKIGW